MNHAISVMQQFRELIGLVVRMVEGKHSMAALQSEAVHS
jgi:hypothetical protein